MTSVAFKVEKLPAPKSALGESPHWDAQTQSIYYVDIVGSEFNILRYDFKANKTYGATIDGETNVSFIIPVAGTTDQFAVGIGRRVGVIQWDGESPKAKLLRMALEVEQSDEFKDNAFNDGKPDPSGRLYAGTLRGVPAKSFNDILEGRTSGALYKFAANEKVVKLLEPVKISNGLAWNTTTNKFYFVDSCDFDVKEFDYDPATGNLSNKRTVIDFKKNGKGPGFIADGLTIDTQGNLYVALFHGSKVLKINPTTGKVELEIEIPTQLVTAIAFGGPNFDVLYVTTASIDLAEPLTDDAGHLFQVTGLGAKGLDAGKVRV